MKQGTRASVAHMVSSCSLSEQPFDVLQLLGAELSQLLAPMHLTALVSTCGTLGRALAGAVQELKRDHRTVRAMLTRCGTTLGFVAGGPRSGLMWGGKSIDANESRLIALLVESGALSQVTWLSLGNNKIGDEGLGSIAVACRADRLAQLKELSLSRNQLSDLALTGLAEAVCLAASTLCARGNQPAILCVSGCVGCVGHPAHAATQLERDWRRRSLRLGVCAAAHGRLSRRRAAAAARAQPQPQPHRRGRRRRVRARVQGWRGARAALGAASLQQCTRLRRSRSMVSAQGPSLTPAPSQGAPGGSGRPYTPRRRSRATRRPVTALAGRASRLQSRLHCVPLAIQASRRSPARAAAARGRRSASTTPRPYPSLAQI